jgi:hypothetical protein
MEFMHVLLQRPAGRYRALVMVYRRNNARHDVAYYRMFAYWWAGPHV